MEKKKANLEKKKGKQFWKKKEKKRKKERESWKKIKKYKKKEGKSTVDYCCNPQWFRCGGTVIPPHHLDIVNIICINVYTYNCQIWMSDYYIVNKNLNKG